MSDYPLIEFAEALEKLNKVLLKESMPFFKPMLDWLEKKLEEEFPMAEKKNRKAS